MNYFHVINIWDEILHSDFVYRHIFYGLFNNLEWIFPPHPARGETWVAVSQLIPFLNNEDFTLSTTSEYMDAMHLVQSRIDDS